MIPTAAKTQRVVLLQFHIRGLVYLRGVKIFSLNIFGDLEKWICLVYEGIVIKKKFKSLQNWIVSVGHFNIFGGFY